MRSSRVGLAGSPPSFVAVVVLFILASFSTSAFRLPAAAAESPQVTVTQYIPVLSPASGIETRIDLTSSEEAPVTAKVWAVGARGEAIGRIGGDIQILPHGTRVIESHEVPKAARSLKIESTGMLIVSAALAASDGSKSEIVQASQASNQLDFSFFNGSEPLLSSLHLVNPNGAAAPVELTGYDASGTELMSVQLEPLGAGASRSIRLNRVFDGETLKIVRTVRLTSNVAIGGFRLTRSEKDFVALPAQSRSAVAWTFDVVGGLNGLKINNTIGVLNVGNGPASLVIESLDGTGKPIGVKGSIRLNPKGIYLMRPSDLGTSTIASVKVSADQPLEGFQLFAAANASGLAAAFGAPADGLRGQGIRLGGKEDGSILNAFPAAEVAPDLETAGETIAVQTPNGGEIWGSGRVYTILWGAAGTDPGTYVSIDLYKNGSWAFTIASGIWLRQYSFKWLVPYNVASGSDYKVRVTSIGPGYWDESDGTFSLRGSRITVAEPALSEAWQICTTHAIQWTYTGSPGSYVTIDLYMGTGMAWMGTIADRYPIGTAAGPNSYSWVIPSNLPPGSYKIRVRSERGIEGYSKYFKLTASGVTVTAPSTAGIVWRDGTSHDIQWRFKENAGSLVTIDLYKGGGWAGTLASNVPIGTAGAGSYTWVVPANQAQGNDYKMRVTTNRGFTDYSNNDFTILSNGVVLTAPGAGPFPAGNTVTIAWQYTPYAGDYVYLDLYKGGSWVGSIADRIPIGTGASGSYKWIIWCGQTPGEDYTIGVSTDLGAVDYSDTPFTISDTGFRVTAPTGGAYNGGSSMSIHWTSTLKNIGDYVYIDLYKGESWVGSIADSIWIVDGGFNWIVWNSATTGSDYRVGVSTDWGVSAFSGYFTINNTQ